MKKLVILGVFLVLGIELLTLSLHQRQLLLWTSGIAVAFLLLGIRRLLGQDTESGSADGLLDDRDDALRRWLTSTETMIRWSESTRTDWDRHLRPILARRFQTTTGHRQARDPATFDATGRMLFGAQLWEWVDPTNVARTGGREPGPGRTALEEILQRLEQL
jgi:hypothetical protein